MGIDDLIMGEPRPGAQTSASSTYGGSARSASAAGLHQRPSVGHHSSAAASSARQSTCYSNQFDAAIRVGAGVVVTSHRQSQRRFVKDNLSLSIKDPTFE